MKQIKEDLIASFSYMANIDDEGYELRIGVNGGNTHKITACGWQPDLTLNQILKEVKDVILEELQNG